MKWFFGSMVLGVAIGYFRLLPKQLTEKINQGMVYIPNFDDNFFEG